MPTGQRWCAHASLYYPNVEKSSRTSLLGQAEAAILWDGHGETKQAKVPHGLAPGTRRKQDILSVQPRVGQDSSSVLVLHLRSLAMLRAMALGQKSGQINGVVGKLTLQPHSSRGLIVRSIDNSTIADTYSPRSPSPLVC